MRKFVFTAVVTATLVFIINALGLIPPQVAAAAGVLGEDFQSLVVDAVGTERVYLYLADQAIVAGQRQEQALIEEVAANRVDHGLAQEKLAEVRDTEMLVRADLAKVGELLQANRTITLEGGDVWTPVRIQEFATREVARHRILVDQVAIYEETVALYAETVAQAEAALVSLRQDLGNVQAQRELLAALVAQGSLLERQANRTPQAGVALEQSRQDIQALIDSQRRANQVAQEMARLNVPATSTPLADSQGQELLSYIHSVTAMAAGR